MLKDKIALVTGSTSGIGLGVAEALAGQGAKIMMNGSRDAAKAEPQRAELEARYGVEVRYTAADASDPQQIADLVKATEQAFGRLDILVNNAGIQHVSPIEDFPIDKWDQIIAINMSSVFHAVRAALPGMKERRFGRIINIASAHGLVASPFKSAYVAAKHGVIGFTKTAALEVATFGITVNSICPGYVLTPLVAKQIPDTAKARGITEEQVKRDVLLAAQPTKEFVTVEQVGALAAFLASDMAASITGTASPIEGGWTAQ
ncbi:MAG: 3-hydroxybutyrate dehydrogenase [Pseudomonadota bacterium]|nr:3-hydroxybutyrate dehydrogenase [Pseudomonadota bacterium]